MIDLPQSKKANHEAFFKHASKKLNYLQAISDLKKGNKSSV